jgi:hypothetical protein
MFQTLLICSEEPFTPRSASFLPVMLQKAIQYQLYAPFHLWKASALFTAAVINKSCPS